MLYFFVAWWCLWSRIVVMEKFVGFALILAGGCGLEIFRGCLTTLVEVV